MNTQKGASPGPQTEKEDFDYPNLGKRALTIEMGSDLLPCLGAVEEEQEGPVFTKAYVLRLFGSILLLVMLLMAGSSAGYLPPWEGMSVDTRVKWSISGVPTEMREKGLVPWWKVALVSVNVDVNIVAGKGKGGGDTQKGLEDGWRLEGGRLLDRRNGQLAAVEEFERGQIAMVDRHPRLHRML
ncbi:hypothetical protein FRC05_011669 [Tulasnella sp. 425]|nr:hypothetical protein FRC05_011669 [Tulasnella sp. 425]